jgi:hypothetical protein
MTPLQRLIAVQASVDVFAVLEAARDEAPDKRGGFIDLIDGMSDERIACAFASLAMLVTDTPDSLTGYRRAS